MRFKKLSSVVSHQVQIIMVLALGFLCMFSLGQAHAVPSAFSLLSPADGASVLTRVLLDWEDSTDPDGLTYTVYLSEGDDSFDDPISIERIDNSTYLLEETDGIEDLSTYYWKVMAVSKYGGTSESESESEERVRHFKTENNVNPTPAWIGGHVYNSFQNPISNIILRVLDLWDRDFSFETDIKGYFFAKLAPDKFMESGEEEEITIEISVEGCISQSVPARIVLNEIVDIGNITLEFDGKGDINEDGGIDLTDAILALRIMAGLQVPISEDVLVKAALSEEDQKIGLSESIYILQKVLSPSPCTQKN
ncbi:hypothetical protein QUF80_12310 [Desulfococcaceae bacterium HSG8]|nr:hypothetical protein [Desulfococcaceae bacterium HSG8]